MHTTIECEIVGVSPLLLHNSQLADPANSYVEAIKKVGKGSTSAKAQQIYDLSWEGSLYLDERQRVVIPGENVESCLVKAAGAIKKKDDFKAGLLCEGASQLDYDGPTDLKELKADARFRDLRSVKTKRGDRVMFCRPKFVDWSLRFTLLVDTDILDTKKVVETLEYAGRYVAIGSFRPKYGRFIVESTKIVPLKSRKSA